MGTTSTKFNSKTTAMEAADNVDLNGKIAIVTGCNTGIGKETVRVLAIHGAKVFMACRNNEKAIAARKDLIESIQASHHKEFDGSALIVMSLDLSSLQSVREFVAKYLLLNQRIDYLICNAGLMNPPHFTPSAEGYELQFAVNHLGHFYLALLLTPLLKKSAPSRVISVASTASSAAPKIDNEANNFITDGMQRKDGPQWLGSLGVVKGYANYGLSKACNVLFAREYNARYAKYGVLAVSLHPGVIATELSRHMPSVAQAFFKLPVITKDIQQGAATTLRCVVLSDEDICGGHYYKDCQEANANLRKDLQPNIMLDETSNGKEIKDVDDNENIAQDTKEVNRNSVGAKLWKWSQLLITSKGFKLEMNGIDNEQGLDSEMKQEVDD